MKKLITALLALILAALLLLACSICTLAANPIDTEKPSSLTLVYKLGDQYFEGLEIKTYKIADAFEDGTFELSAPFDSLHVSIHGITTQAEWKAVTSTLAAYAIADGIKPTVSSITDDMGKVEFKDLSPALYLTLAVKSETEDRLTRFESFITAIPADDTEGGHNYDVTAYPKCESFDLSEDDITYKIVKQWADSQNTDKRPESVEIDILKDGKFFRTEKLSAENNWSYTWTVDDDGSDWQAVERNVPDKYSVTVTNKAKTITITNTYNAPDSSAPQTGETFVLWPYILIMGFAGGLTVAVAIWRKRFES